MTWHDPLAVVVVRYRTETEPAARRPKRRLAKYTRATIRKWHWLTDALVGFERIIRNEEAARFELRLPGEPLGKLLAWYVSSTDKGIVPLDGVQCGPVARYIRPAPKIVESRGHFAYDVVDTTTGLPVAWGFAATLEAARELAR